jgi:hypothetical protein
MQTMPAPSSITPGQLWRLTGPSLGDPVQVHHCWQYAVRSAHEPRAIDACCTPLDVTTLPRARAELSRRAERSDAELVLLRRLISISPAEEVMTVGALEAPPLLDAETSLWVYGLQVDGRMVPDLFESGEQAFALVQRARAREQVLAQRPAERHLARCIKCIRHAAWVYPAAVVA